MEADKFGYTLRQERAKLVTIAKSSVLAKNIVNRSLNPILDALDGIYQEALVETGKHWKAKLRATMVARAPSGKLYRIIDVDENAPPAQAGQRSQKYHQIGEWQASSPGQPPGFIPNHEAFYQSLNYKVEEGVLILGQIIPPDGEGDLMGEEIHPLFFKGRNKKDIKEGYAGRLFVSDDADQHPVRMYAGALEHGFRNRVTGRTIKREWWAKNMQSMREEIREEIRTRIWAAIRKRTRSTQIQKALIIKIYMEKF
jgi:hypothetical protein